MGITPCLVVRLAVPVGRPGGRIQSPAVSFLEQHLGSGTWRADPPFSSVTFKVRHLGARDYRAGFREIDATLDPVAGTLTASVPIASLDLNNPVIRERMLSAEFLDAAWFPRCAGSCRSSTATRAARSRRPVSCRSTATRRPYGDRQDRAVRGRSPEPREPRRRRAVVGRRPARLRAGLAGAAACRRRHAGLGRHARGPDRVRRAAVAMRRLLRAVLVLALVGPPAGCGGDDEPGTAAATTATTATSGPIRRPRPRRPARCRRRRGKPRQNASPPACARRATGCRAACRRSRTRSRRSSRSSSAARAAADTSASTATRRGHGASRSGCAGTRRAERRLRRTPRRHQRALGRPARPERSRERPRLPHGLATPQTRPPAAAGPSRRSA